jgi:RNA polymerase sigma factor (sigma-70 family)
VRGRPLEATHEESLIVEQARRGDPAAFGILVHRYQEAAFHLAYVIVGEGSEAEDVAQEAFLKAYVALPSFRPVAPFRPWLLQIVANEARNRRRSAGRRAYLAVRAAADERLTSGAAEPSPEAIALADEQRRALLAEVDALRDEDRLAIAGRYFMDLSEAEIADMLGCARGTVKSRVSRGLARLRERLVAREAIAILVGLIMLGLGLLAWPDARNAIAERLGLRGVSITHVPEVPTPLPIPTPPPGVPTALPTPAGVALGLGTPLTLEQARERFGPGLLLPEELGTPDGVYLTTGLLSLVYAPRQSLPPVPPASGVGLLLTEFRATLDTSLVLGKGVPPGTRVEEVRVNGNQGFWIDGAPHLFFRESNTSMRDVPPRLAGNTLLWEQAGLTLRVESALSRDAAMRVAASVRGTD